jgi:hypothetical protein
MNFHILNHFNRASWIVGKIYYIEYNVVYMKIVTTAILPSN